VLLNATACEITLFWVKENYRNKGYGQALVNAAEAEAKKEKCKTIFLRSYSFQAPSFYQKHGYKVEHKIKDFLLGRSSFCLVKTLSEI
jgi:ribosomal protein S18 acetylase RimI-like enzyme